MFENLLLLDFKVPDASKRFIHRIARIPSAAKKLKINII